MCEGVASNHVRGAGTCARVCFSVLFVELEDLTYSLGGFSYKDQGYFEGISSL